jgi:hypothetical protein
LGRYNPAEIAQSAFAANGFCPADTAAIRPFLSPMTCSPQQQCKRRAAEGDLPVETARRNCIRSIRQASNIPDSSCDALAAYLLRAVR